MPAIGTENENRLSYSRLEIFSRRTGRRVVLEAMPAHERRLIHLALRDHPKVYTKSIGTDENRKVTIVPK